MSLVDLNVPIRETAVPATVRSLIREANRRIKRFRLDGGIPGFIPSDFERAYGVLHALAVSDHLRGNLFCEWGSGFGVVACLASLLDFDACGIEIEGELVDAAQRLAYDFGLPVEFIRGTFIPKGGEACFDPSNQFAWLTPDEGSAYEELDLTPDDFDIIFAYPWPDEERVTGDLFEHYAGEGAVLLTYHGSDDLRSRQKTGWIWGCK